MHHLWPECHSDITGVKSISYIHMYIYVYIIIYIYLDIGWFDNSDIIGAFRPKVVYCAYTVGALRLRKLL